MYFSRIQLRPDIAKNTQLAQVLSDSSYNMHRLLWDLFPGQKQRHFLYREEIAREQLGTQKGVRGEPIFYVISEVKPISDKPLFNVETKDYQPKLQEGDRLSFELRANPVVTKKTDRQNTEQYLKERSRRQVTDKNKLTKKRIRHDVVMNAQQTFLSSLCDEFNLRSYLSFAPKKREYKRILLTHGGDALDKRLTTILKEDSQYAELLHQSMQLHSKLEWSIKSIIDDALVKWLIDQGAQNGFILNKDDNNQYKLQNSVYRWHSIKSNNGMKSGFSSVDFIGDLQIINIEKFKKALFEGIGRSKAFGCGLMLVRRA